MQKGEYHVVKRFFDGSRICELLRLSIYIFVLFAIDSINHLLVKNARIVFPQNPRARVRKRQC